MRLEKESGKDEIETQRERKEEEVRRNKEGRNNHNKEQKSNKISHLQTSRRAYPTTTDKPKVVNVSMKSGGVDIANPTREPMPAVMPEV